MLLELVILFAIKGVLLMFDDYRTVAEVAKEWGINKRTVQTMCKDGRIKGAAKFSGSWAIPVETEKPTDNRITTDEYKNWKKAKSIIYYDIICCCVLI